VDRTKTLVVAVVALVIVLIAALAPVSPFGRARVPPSLAGDDDTEFKQAMAKVRVVVQEPEATTDWVSVYRAILKLKELGNPACAPLLAQLLAREEPLNLQEGSPLPGVMPPLEMLKSVAIDTLAEVRAREQLPAIESVRQQTRFAVLRDAASNAIRAIEGDIAE
jgi:hypothetical protein